MHTGNTSRLRLNRRPETVYPCAYREHLIVSSANSVLPGLSLCILQGTPTTDSSGYCSKRFIPVHTGNTHNGCRLSSLHPVYPCAYREHIYKPYPIKAQGGLSLCIQGTQEQLDKEKQAERFIPVHTGNTPIKSTKKFLFSVYPCAYREHSKYI